MQPSFFLALNPTSTLSGVYCNKPTKPFWEDSRYNQLHDLTVKKAIQAAWYKGPVGAVESVKQLYNILMGSHYEHRSGSRFRAHDGSKGVLDFLIFPLLARKCVFYYLRNGDETDLGTKCGKIAALTLGVLLEIPRATLGFALTLILAPLAMLIDLFKPMPQRSNLAYCPEILPTIAISDAKQYREAFSYTTASA